MKKIFLLLFTLTLFSCKDENVKPVPVQDSPKPTKVLMIVTSNNSLKNGNAAGYFLPEAIDFYQQMHLNNIEVDVASPKGGRAPMYRRSQYTNMYRNALEQTGLLNKLDSSLKISDLKADDYIAIYYAGGFACLFDFPQNEELAKLAAIIYENNNGVVAAVCHGPAGLLNIKLNNGNYLVKGKKVTSRLAEEDLTGIEREDLLKYYFPFILQEELEKRELIFTQRDPSFVEVDGRLITGQGPEASTGIALKVLELIKK